MRLGVRELRRRPGRFAGAGAVLTLVAVLLVFLGGLADGLNANNDSAVRAQPGELVVFAATADRTIPQSAVDAEQRVEVLRVPGVEAVGGLDLLQVGARLPDRDARDIVDVGLFAHELPVDGASPLPRGQVWADRVLAARGIEEGMTVRLGPARVPVELAGFVDGTGYQGQGTLWASPETFAEVATATASGDSLAPGTSRVLVVDVADGATADQVADAVDRVLDGATETLTRDEAADAVLDVGGGVLNAIVGLTAGIAVLVVALFFALLTLERAPLFAVLKAFGARTRTLFAGVVTQAVALAAVAGIVAVGLGVLVDRAIDPGAIPFQLSTVRAVASVVQLLVAALIGSALCIRRIARTDPVTTIGRTP